MRSALRFIAGAALAAAVWYFGTPYYNSVLSAAAEVVLQADARLRHVDVSALDTRIRARGDATQPDLPVVLIPADQLTYNVVLFVGLFATSRGVTRRFLIALLILFLTHIAAVAVSIESTYATRVQLWSDRNYSSTMQDFWSAAEYAYRLAGMFAIAFACWWVSVRRDP